MSNVNIKRAVQNIKTGTTVYSPLVEVIVNGIEAIEDGDVENGKITITVERSKQLKLDGVLQNVESFEISDNGIGFTDENRESFDTLYSDKKAKGGGKGFGRFVCLKYFDSLKVNSIYQDDDSFKSRTFFMGKDKDIIVREEKSPTDSKESGSSVLLSSVKAGKFPDKKLQTIARSLVEKLLPYFISNDYVCP